MLRLASSGLSARKPLTAGLRGLNREWRRAPSLIGPRVQCIASWATQPPGQPVLRRPGSLLAGRVSPAPSSVTVYAPRRTLATRVASPAREESGTTTDDGKRPRHPKPTGLTPELEALLPKHCNGCGVELQKEEPDAPGYYQVPAKLVESLLRGGTGAQGGEATLDPGAGQVVGGIGAARGSQREGSGKYGDFRDNETVTMTIKGAIPGLDAELGRDLGDDALAVDDGVMHFDDDELEFDDDELVWDDDDDDEDDLDGDVAADVARGRSGGLSAELPEDRELSADEKLALFDSIVEGWDDELDAADVATRGPRQRRRGDDSLRVDVSEGEQGVRLLCARCHSLTHYGTVKSTAAEDMLPEFDLGKKVGRKIALQKDRRAVVLCVVDVADFDGSLPRAALRELIPDELWDWNYAKNETREQRLARRQGSGPAARVKLVLVANKVDLLPKTATEARLKHWVRSRAKAGGLPKPASIHLVSSTKGLGIQTVMRDLQKQLGLRGDVWVVGAQNAGKSSLINAMKRVAGTADRKTPAVTEAPLPGTTLGLIRVGGLPLPPKSNCFDTPGVPHPYQLSARLNPEEVRMLLPERKLRPRTYRIGAGMTLLLGGLAAIDIVDCPGPTMYLTVWMSDLISLHCGRTEKAQDTWKRHAGNKLSPPIGGEERVTALGELVSTRVTVDGDDWKRSSTDIHIAGLGWVAMGLSGEARCVVRAHDGVAITTHDALLPDYAREFERPGFSDALPSAPGGGGEAAGKKKGKKPKRKGAKR